MSILVVGSIALDSVETPFGTAEEALGGAAVYFSYAASFFNRVRLVGVIGEDFPEEHLQMLGERNIDLAGLERGRGATFRWKGRYDYDLNEAHTLDTQLNVFETFAPKIPDEFKDSDFVFLANIQPGLQLQVARQATSPRVIACDTMNFWIEGAYDQLRETLKSVDILIINDAETRELAREPSLVKAARKILEWGPTTLVVKRGEFGVLMFHGKSVFSAPAYPLEDVFDPTGAGDTFAGGFMGYLSTQEEVTETAIRQAIVFGSTLASFNVEDFSLNRMKTLQMQEILDRFAEFKLLSHFEEIDADGF
ncbi:MAG: PfkB family carbohydrate kinase [Thermoleophilia bacterium]|nr:PfkB family carbohydrate kinase [Actinomycetota bacterium]MCL5882895.1 PfkB family carbohydrate kinase [Actinomycetota bacterium]